MIDIIHSGMYEHKAKLLKESMTLKYMLKIAIKKVCPEFALEFWQKYKNRKSKQN